MEKRQPNLLKISHLSSLQIKMRCIYKNKGETPLQCLRRNSPTDNIKRTYAGRLDPMASGWLLILEGDECKDAKNYHGLNKKYIYELILGIQTDSYDLLGIPQKIEIFNQIEIPIITGHISMPYPAYASKTLSGVPLFTYAKNKLLNTISIPRFDGTIYEHKILDSRTVKGKDIANEILNTIPLISGDFRQDEIRVSWEKFKTLHQESEFPIYKLEIKVSSGVYIRSIANHIGELLNKPSVLFSLERTEIESKCPN